MKQGGQAQGGLLGGDHMQGLQGLKEDERFRWTSCVWCAWSGGTGGGRRAQEDCTKVRVRLSGQRRPREGLALIPHDVGSHVALEEVTLADSHT